MLEPAGPYNSVPTVNATDVTVNLAWGPDQISWPRVVTSRTQDQWYSFRGMNTFGWRSADFNRQNMKFMRIMAGHGDMSLDIVFHNNAQKTSNLIDSIAIDGVSLANGGTQFVVAGGSRVYTANQWYTHHVMYHGNTIRLPRPATAASSGLRTGPFSRGRSGRVRHPRACSFTALPTAAAPGTPVGSKQTTSPVVRSCRFKAMKPIVRTRPTKIQPAMFASSALIEAPRFMRFSGRPHGATPVSRSS